MHFAIDSDGCVFDNMTWKHTNGFGPKFIEVFNLTSHNENIQSLWNQINLYSKTRGINRFAAFATCLKHIELQYPNLLPHEISVEIPTLCKFLENPEHRTTQKIKDLCPESSLKTRIQLWNNGVNDFFQRSKVKCPPFSSVRQTLSTLSKIGNIAIVSQAPHQTLIEEWRLFEIDSLPTVILGQEYGSKKTQIKSTFNKPSEVVIIGDALGDYQTAQELKSLFYPITPKAEDESWQCLNNFVQSQPFHHSSAREFSIPKIQEFMRFLDL